MQDCQSKRADAPASPPLRGASRYTSGPWAVDRDGTSISVRAPWTANSMGYGPRGAGIAKVLLHTQNADEIVANADLLAAAPDLLKALWCFLEDDRFHVAVGGNPIVVEGMLAFARAAVAKASGETP